MCRLLVCRPGEPAADPGAWTYLTAPTRSATELAAGILPGWGRSAPPLPAAAVQAFSSPTGLVGVTLSALLADPAFWAAYRALADYGGLWLLPHPCGVAVGRLEPAAWGQERIGVADPLPPADQECAECRGVCQGWLYHPHPGRLVTGAFAEIFGPLGQPLWAPEHLCACALDEDPATDSAAVAAFRTDVTAVIRRLGATLPLLVLKDAWYAEPVEFYWEALLSVLATEGAVLDEPVC